MIFFNVSWFYLDTSIWALHSLYLYLDSLFQHQWIISSPHDTHLDSHWACGRGFLPQWNTPLSQWHVCCSQVPLWWWEWLQWWGRWRWSQRWGRLSTFLCWRWVWGNLSLDSVLGFGCVKVYFDDFDNFMNLCLNLFHSVLWKCESVVLPLLLFCISDICIRCEVALQFLDNYL